MASRMRGNSHVRFRPGEKAEIISKLYLSESIASTLFDVSFQGASCSVIESQVLKNCDACNLRYMCNKIDEAIREYTEKTTVVAACFNFGVSNL